MIVVMYMNDSYIGMMFDKNVLMKYCLMEGFMCVNLMESFYKDNSRLLKKF